MVIWDEKRVKLIHITTGCYVPQAEVWLSGFGNVAFPFVSVDSDNET